MKEFDWNFFKKGKRVAVHLATKMEAEDFCRQLNGRWEGETLNARFWSIDEDRTCCEFHGNDLIYRSIDDYTANDNCEILEWNDYMKNVNKNNKKFNWKRFKKKNKIAVHCKTEEEANDFCKKMNEHGLKWALGASYLDENHWNTYKEDTCYINGMYSDKNFYSRNGYEILEWSDFMFKKSLMKSDLKNDMILEDREGRKYLVINSVLSREGACHPLNSFREDLSHTYFSEYDIVAAYRIKNDFFGPLKEIFKDRNLILTWKRKSSKREE